MKVLTLLGSKPLYSFIIGFGGHCSLWLWDNLVITYVSVCECVCSYFHNPIPVVSSGHSKQCEEGHPKILKGCVTTQTLTWVVVIAL